MPQFKWKLGSYVGGDVAVHQAYKPYLVLRNVHPDWQALGAFTIQARDTANIQVSGLPFDPTVVMLISFRPKNANGAVDSAFGQRGGGMTVGVAGWETSTTTLWHDDDAYTIGDRVAHNSVQYIAANNNLNSEPPSGDWTIVPITQFTGTSRIRNAFDQVGCRWREDVMFDVMHQTSGPPILTLSLVSFDEGGFTLSQDVNLYDQTDSVAWLAIGGKHRVGVMNAGDTSISGFDGTPSGAMFLSTKHKGVAEGDPYRIGYWDHMTGFASSSGYQAAIWGGRRPTSWDWTTERWVDTGSILLCTPASGSSFLGVGELVRGYVSDWYTGGVDFQYDVFDGQPYRIGYVLFDTAEAGVIETNWETRPAGSQSDADGNNTVPTNIRPDVVLMAATNYNFSYSNADPFDFPRSPNEWGKGGSGGLGWHAAPFSELGYDAWGVHTFGNAVAERGRFANAGTQLFSRYIMPGQGANSNPPAYHQHSVNIVGNPVIAGLNYRYAERHASVKRLHVNESDLYIP